ncbi:glutamate--tRNA ligase [Scenedesmus sp. PABB004]|nr:glutamate--tRNA ligase [Scenedesmus sp. PABB004]
MQPPRAQQHAPPPPLPPGQLAAAAVEVLALPAAFSLVERANLPALQAALAFPELTAEARVLRRLQYKGRSQHRAGRHHQATVQVLRALDLLAALQLPALVQDLHAAALRTSQPEAAAGSSDGAQPRRGASRQPGPPQPQPPGARQAVRLPCSAAGARVARRVLCGAALLCDAQAAALAAGAAASGQLSRGFFMPACLAAAASLGRLRALAAAALLAALQAYAALVELLPLLPQQQPGGASADDDVRGLPALLNAVWRGPLPRLQAIPFADGDGVAARRAQLRELLCIGDVAETPAVTDADELRHGSARVDRADFERRAQRPAEGVAPAGLGDRRPHQTPPAVVCEDRAPCRAAAAGAATPGAPAYTTLPGLGLGLGGVGLQCQQAAPGPAAPDAGGAVAVDGGTGAPAAVVSPQTELQAATGGGTSAPAPASLPCSAPRAASVVLPRALPGGVAAALAMQACGSSDDEDAGGRWALSRPQQSLEWQERAREGEQQQQQLQQEEGQQEEGQQEDGPQEQEQQQPPPAVPTAASVPLQQQHAQHRMQPHRAQQHAPPTPPGQLAAAAEVLALPAALSLVERANLPVQLPRFDDHVKGAPAENAREVRAGKPLNVQRAWKNCSQGVYVDVGSNVGVQIRKLFSPQLFPGAAALPVFSEYFGEHREGVCAVGFEPNPAHAAYLSELNAHFQRRGRQAFIFQVAAAHTRGTAKMFHDSAAAATQHEWGAGLGHNPGIHGVNATVEDVPLVSLAEFFASVVQLVVQEEAARSGKAPPVVAKFDAEGAEFLFFPPMLLSGQLCAIDFVFAEWHDYMRDKMNASVRLSSAQHKQTLEAYRAGSPGCKVKLSDLDDESYRTVKLTWLADVPGLVPLTLCDFDHLITKKKVEEDDNFQALVNPRTKTETAALGDVNMAGLARGAILQLERKGMLLAIPDGRTKRSASSSAVLQQPQQCAVATQYVSSELERAWLDNAREWQGSSFCERAAAHDAQAAVWLQALADGGGDPLAEHDPAVFSRFESTVTCPNGSEARVVSWIEPLAFGLRHPRALCKGHDIMDRSYLLLATQRAARAPGVACSGRRCRSLYFDLGAGTWGANADGHQPSQGWFYETFKARGLEFDHMYMWEARVHPPAELFKHVPGAVHAKYQYFNLPVSTDPGEPSHPLQVLKAVAQPGDYVLFKLDLDNTAVETSIFKAMLRDAELLGLIDEFLFEYHVNFAPMVAAGWGGTVDPNATLADAFQLFAELRRRGVRAHSWV